jgi:hypothetical protein
MPATKDSRPALNIIASSVPMDVCTALRSFHHRARSVDIDPAIKSEFGR